MARCLKHQLDIIYINTSGLLLNTEHQPSPFSQRKTSYHLLHTPTLKMRITYFLTILSAIAPLVVSAIPSTRSNTYAGEKCDLNGCHKCTSRCPLGCIDPMQHAVCLSHCRMFPFPLCYEEKESYYKGRRNVNEKQMLSCSNTRYDVRRGA
jgi:hypothetical protein